MEDVCESSYIYLILLTQNIQVSARKKLTYLRILKKCREQANVLNEICQEGRLLRT